MRRWSRAIAAAGAVALGVAGLAGKERSSRGRPRPAVRLYAVALVDRLGESFDDLDAAIERGDPRVARSFAVARARYKRLEPLLELYSPALASALNGRRQEIDDEDQPAPVGPPTTGFPALEPTLWPRVRRDEARAVVARTRSVLKRAGELAGAIEPTDAQLVEAARLELFRVETLGIAGFDATGRAAALREAADAVDGVNELLLVDGARRWPDHEPERGELSRRLRAASVRLRASDSVDADRLTLLVDYLLPASRALAALRASAHVPPLTMPRPLRAAAATPYDAGAFAVEAYAPSGSPAVSSEMAALGRRLFHDPILSGNGARSCASCHDPRRAFADGLRANVSLRRPRMRLPRNTPTLLNAALQPTQFADERATSLEEQAAQVLANGDEMGSSADRAAARVALRDSYRRDFARAFGTDERHAVTPLRLRQAIAAYERTILTLNSRFDRAVRGDASAITAEERRGFTLFMGKARCGTCHFAPLFGGVMPPSYKSSDVEVIGVPVRPDGIGGLDPDLGRGRVDGVPTHLRAFKTPSLRNAALTAPYMHNGAFATLAEVLDFYDRGGRVGSVPLPANRTLPADSLHLHPDEQRAIIAFIGALTDTAVDGASISRRNER